MMSAILLSFCRHAYEVRHRVKSSEFLHTTSSLIRTLEGYKTFKYETQTFTENFQRDVALYVRALNALSDQLQYDIDKVLFNGV